MADTYGAVQIPIQAPAAGEEITDPAISLIAGYFKAVLNAYAQTAWNSVAPTITGLVTVPGGLASPVVRKAFGHNPEEEDLNENDLPALYVWRGPKGARPIWLAEDYRVSPDTWTMIWLFRPAQQNARRLRQSFINGVMKIVDATLESQRDPNYVAPGDTDPLARSVAAVPTAIKLSVASSTSAQTYSGAALDGAIGGTVFAPALIPTVTVAGSARTGTVLFTGIGADAEVRVSRVDITGPAGTYTGDFALTQITSIYVPAQLDTYATMSFGLAASTGLGTDVLVLGKFLSIEVSGWEETVLALQMGDQSPVRSYEGIKITFDVQERWERDTSALDATTAAPQFTGSTNNTDVRETAFFT